MEPHGPKRKLTTILAADVEGYSRLMNADEEATLKTLSAYRQIIDGLIAQHEGRLFGSAGDSVLAEFASAVEAVRCAIAVQKELATRNADLPDDRKMRYRIGVNLGDVMVEGDNLLGDGVNVAARLERLAEPGGICISGDAYRQVRGKIENRFDDLGDRKLKNIAEPVHVYQILSNPRAPSGTPEHKDARTLPLPDKPSIAVLPFDNMSGDPEQEYFSDGITEDIITDLSKISGLFVIARNSTFTYKGKPVNVQQIGRELGVCYVLEGSIRKAGERVRITAQLVDATSGSHLWAERYDRVLEDIFSIQDEIREKVVAALKIKLNEEEQTRLLRRWTSNSEAYEYLLRGIEPFRHLTNEGNALAREMFEKAVRLDPQSAGLWDFLAWTHAQDARFRWSDPPGQSLEKAAELAQKALALDDSFAGTYSLLGDLHLIKGEHEIAIALGRKAIALSPNMAAYRALLALTLFYSGRPEEAISLTKEAMRLDPHYPGWYVWTLGQSYRSMGQYEQAILAFKELLTREPNSLFPHMGLITAYTQTGQLEEARAHVSEVLEMDPGISIKAYAQTAYYKHPSDLKRDMDALRKAGLPE
jgi:adenylate cyclase